ncbi:MAG: ribonuclease H [Gemmatimonadota bacterium]|nr:ribonuclease H [Gemmatimonadota bacterium]
MDGGTVYIYADESCLGNQFRGRARPGAAAGLLERFDSRRGWYRKDFACFEADTTNNRMALRSGALGLRSLRRASDVVFTSDSRYLVTGMKEWVHAWARKGWSRRGGPIENLDLWRELVVAARPHRIEWRWVKGHAGHPKNEYVNFLAVRTARSGQAPAGLAPSGFPEWLEAQRERGRYEEWLDVPPAEPFRPDPSPPAA